ncbi:hypothetical protein LCGC14_2917860 [marine sediment metagenome]|uniref:Transposase IS204/IS1001/IS1096/IS1165 zinc-finger domain-containing protein n=1 Tax=marine sediment metagenome TaxID=412755 RepID=A0A0F8XPX4_9ZZZZ
MQLKTILNRVTNYKSFVVEKVSWAEDSEQLALVVTMRPRANGRPICSGCGKVRSGYDRAAEPRRFEFVPLWMIPVLLLYRMRRVDCPTCGVKVERVPWADGKSPMTTEYKWFLARRVQCFFGRCLYYARPRQARARVDAVYTMVGSTTLGEQLPRTLFPTPSMPHRITAIHSHNVVRSLPAASNGISALARRQWHPAPAPVAPCDGTLCANNRRDNCLLIY